jgi:hypothetical protein
MKPIIFNTDMVRAILDGRKTQTRMLMKEQPPREDYTLQKKGDKYKWYVVGGTAFLETQQPWFKPPYQVGDILYVREPWQPDTCTIWMNGLHPVAYKATDYMANINRGPYGAHWRPSVQMPKWAARLFLEVTDRRVEQVQDITFGDAIADGGFTAHGMRSESKVWFVELWDSIYAKKGLGWDANPWVWVYTFKIIDKPAEV